VDDFFIFNDVPSNMSQEHMSYLNDKDRDIAMLDRHPHIKQLYVRYNTALPSSAPVEWLFSSGSIILSKLRNRLGDNLYEKLLLLKVNGPFW